jgi:phage terminase small subunit
MPARKSRALKVLRGTNRPDREPTIPSTPQRGQARPPKWLPATERAAFRALAMETERTGTPSRSFQMAVTGGALTWASLKRCTAVIDEKGETYESRTTTGALKILVRPEVHLRNTMLRLLKGYLAELGLTPSSIGRVDCAALPREEDELSARRRRFLEREFFTS